MTERDIKDKIEQLLKNNGWTTYLFTRTESLLFYSVFGVWFFANNEWFFTPFSSPWTQWDMGTIDQNIADWMKDRDHVARYLLVHPMLCRTNNSSTVCECGAEATYGPNAPGHSPWCQKYKSNPYTGQ